MIAVALLAAFVAAFSVGASKSESAPTESTRRHMRRHRVHRHHSQAGLTWRHCNGAFGGVYFPEIKGSGCAIIDYNNDGWPELLLVNCMHWPGHRTPEEPTMVLYHNNRNGTFTDVTKEAGLDVPMFGMGAAVGDYDNDGWDDIFIAAYGGNHLFHNDHGIFIDVSRKPVLVATDGNRPPWLDYDNDGYLDLFV